MNNNPIKLTKIPYIWHKWFAWYPVAFVGNSTLTWCVFIARKLNVIEDEFGDKSFHYIYRDIEDKILN